MSYLDFIVLAPTLFFDCTTITHLTIPDKSFDPADNLFYIKTYLCYNMGGTLVSLQKQARQQPILVQFTLGIIGALARNRRKIYAEYPHISHNLIATIVSLLTLQNPSSVKTMSKNSFFSYRPSPKRGLGPLCTMNELDK